MARRVVLTRVVHGPVRPMCRKHDDEFKSDEGSKSGVLGGMFTVTNADRGNGDEVGMIAGRMGIYQALASRFLR